MNKSIDLSLYENGICFIKYWCGDSENLATQLQSYAIPIVYVDEENGHVFNFDGTKFVQTEIKVDLPNINTDNYEYVPLLYLKNKLTKKYKGPWSTHGGNKVTFVTFSGNTVYNINSKHQQKKSFKF
tara:strand:+ start:4349 stop:4729 length:381 start_codon:yes stop_codon:yes gene_type:complete